MSQRSDSRGSPAANSTRLALRTCSMVATRTAILSRCVLRCFGSRFASSALMPSVQTTIPFTCAMARSHVRATTESLHHTSPQPVKPFSRKLMDVELFPGVNVAAPVPITEANVAQEPSKLEATNQNATHQIPQQIRAG